MSLGAGEPAAETGDDSLSAVTFDSDFETKAKRKSYHKPPPTSPKSPYYSKPKKVASWRALRTAGSMPLGGRVSLTPQKLWLGTSKPGGLTQPLKPDLTSERTWTNPPCSPPDYLSEALRVKRAHLRRSASSGHVPGTPVYREKEDMYDEIIELKKSLHVQRSDVDLMRTKLRRLEEENSRKDRQIEQLLDPARGPEFVRTLAEKRPDAGWVVNGLKQRILKLEQQCKEKDSTINKLQTDMKTTSLEEMRIAMETYYEEIHRLQTLLASSETTGKKPPVERKTGLKKQRKVSSALLSLSRSVQELTEENQSLKEDLDRVLSSSPSAPGVQGYVEWSKPRLLRRIAELEKKINLMESAKPHAPELARSSPLTQPASSPVVPLAPPDEECERLRGALRSLRDERAALNAQLLDRGLEVKQLQQTKADLEQELRSVKESEKEGREREEALRVEIQTLTKKFQELEEIKKEEKDDPVEVTHEAPEEPPASHPASSRTQQDAEPDSGESCPSPSSRCAGGQEGRRREEAARLLQSRWKAHRHKKREAALDEAATVLQAAFRGHLARAKLLSGSACGAGSPSMPRVPSRGSPAPGAQSPTSQAACAEQEAITVIQSVFRAHLARTWQSAPSGRTATAAPPRPRSASAACRGAAAPLLAASPEPPSGPPPATTPPLDDVHSDDSDDVISPSLPGKKAASPPRLRGQPSGGSSGHGQGARPLPST
ncbi:IQ domain-containing protein E isoform X2 [Dasypus novemcinctus]|uniref:IQ domain-containing protein E isoform X2 n=1 Tax=Dasypus novemcinctus TaxID=9361 RepID=UPI00265D650B|nr:IQ domain-containing protein E isoform X2 [Dasypus novemcinctus]